MLTWDNNSLPDTFSVGGNKVTVDFEDLKGFGLGNTTMVHAFITNRGEVLLLFQNPMP